ncbi:hypothetical protein SASPL_109322 [Salvia splendens]|uniref:Uncharacterized protein n=1 Tax=Salvia splendens TaxID=180675 RepID=A0A8X8YGW7_SALSN|nr:hypothetical protein SASPL_109322 [Salvia splendens]
MSKNYDNWEKLVGAVLKIEQFQQVAMCNSTSCSTISDDISYLWLDDDAPKYPTLSLYYDATHTATIWGMFLSPPQEFHSDLHTIPSLVPGKVVFLPVEAREFVIQTHDSPAQYFPFSRKYENGSRFETVGINTFSAVDIRGKIRTRLLTSNTIYGAYLIFKLAYDPYDGERGSGREKAVCRSDRWTEFQIGSFYVDGADEQEMEARVVETSNRWKGGLLVGGIEFRPLVSVKQL